MAMHYEQVDCSLTEDGQILIYFSTQMPCVFSEINDMVGLR